MNTPRTNAAPISGERACAACNDTGEVFADNGEGPWDCAWCGKTAPATRTPEKNENSGLNEITPDLGAVSGERVREALPDIPPVGHPLQKLGAYLADILSEDRWLQAEALMLDVWNESAIPLAAQPETAGLALLYNVWCMHSQEQDDEWFYQWRQLMQAIELELSRSKYGPSLSAPVNAAQPEGK